MPRTAFRAYLTSWLRNHGRSDAQIDRILDAIATGSIKNFL